MTLLEHNHKPITPETDAIAELHRTFADQQAAFRRHRYPSLPERRAHLEALAGMMLANRQRIREALRHDFAVHPELYSDLIEIVSVPARAAYAISQLETWMADDDRNIDPAFYGTARAFVRHQPKGVVGNIVPWNFPFDVGVGPLVEMLAAGNRVIVKPSDFTPACGELLAEMLATTFDADHVTAVVGGLHLAQAFPTLPWDHLLFTGSPSIGRSVAQTAAENLVPTTLELGGKCPAVILDDAVDDSTVRDILGTKMMKNGQMCISVDHVFVPRDRLSEFVGLAQRYVRETTPSYSRSNDCTGIITERHLDRLLDLLAEARESGYEIVDLEEGGRVDRTSRRMPLSLVLDPGDELGLMQEEIFGPILPVLPYDRIEDVLDHIDARERPLAVYIFGHDPERTDDVLTRTTSGGAGVNVCAAQGGLPALGFGGVGNSGTGRHHGIEGFREFSNPRGVVERGTGDRAELFYAPYGDALQAVMDGVFGSSIDD